MLWTIIAFLVMLNPLAMSLYLQPRMKELSDRNFRRVLYKAGFISFVIYIVSFFIGEWLFDYVIQIDLEIFPIFGGIIIFSYESLFIVRGTKGFVQMKGKLDDLASEIALPFMVSAATTSLSILISYEFMNLTGLLILLIVMALNFFTIMLLKYIRTSISKRRFRIAFDKNMEILLRLNGFLLGDMGVNMIITGINNLYL